MTGAPKKSRKFIQPDAEEGLQSDDDSHDGQQEVQAFFEGRNPEGQDFDSIKQLLLQLFNNVPIDLSPISDLIISQAGLGAVLKQSFNDSDDEEDSEMIEDVAYGVTTILNLTQNRESPWVQQLYQFMEENCSRNSDENTKASFKEILQNNKVGLLLNERFLNIPAPVSLLLLGSLQKEFARMKRKNEAYNFQYFLMFIKIVQDKSDETSPPAFSNAEEELFYKQADYCFDYDASNGSAAAEGSQTVPLRRVILFKSDKFDSIINELPSFVDAKSMNIISNF